MPKRRPRGPRPPTAPPDSEAAFEIALRFLATRPRTRWEVERRLRRSGASDGVIDAALERLVSLGYLDDQAFARWWAEQRDRHAPRGRRMLEAELRQRGVTRETIEIQRAEAAARANTARAEGGPGIDPTGDGEALPATERARAEAALARHLRGRPLPADPRAVQRVGMYLMRRGFDPETVRHVLRHAGAEPALEQGHDGAP